MTRWVALEKDELFVGDLVWIRVSPAGAAPHVDMLPAEVKGVNETHAEICLHGGNNCFWVEKGFLSLKRP